jgi:hypothetical protein
VLEEKYPQADSTSFGFANRFTVGNRFIVSACEYINDHSDEVDYDTATDAILSIKYVDKPLRNTVLDERVSQVDKSNSKSRPTQIIRNQGIQMYTTQTHL